MTDERILECAKALTDELNRMGREGGQPDSPMTYFEINLTRACILKWLSMKPTKSMTDEGASCINYDGDGIGTLVAAEKAGRDARLSYLFMCQQAVKEIGGA